MSRISRYQESILKFIKTKSPYSELTKFNNSEVESLISISDHEASIVLLTVLNCQNKKKKIKSHHGYYMSSGVDLMMVNVMINDNIDFYKKEYGEINVKNLLNQSPSYIYECLSQNLETLNNMAEKDKFFKVQKRIYSYLHKKMLDITKCDNFIGNEYVHRTDIIKYNFSNKNLINTKYKKLKIVEKELLIDYVDRTYGSVCQSAFVIGWLLGLGDEKHINNLEKMGSYLGLLIKLANDFNFLERDIENSENISLNLIVNFGIFECFDLFDESKNKLLEGCLKLDIYSITIKEIIDNIERKFDEKLKNAELDLNSKYTSFSTR